MTKEVLFAQRSFVNELGLLVDRHSMADDCMREKFADFATDMLCLIDGCTDTPWQLICCVLLMVALIHLAMFFYLLGHTLIIWFLEIYITILAGTVSSALLRLERMTL